MEQSASYRIELGLLSGRQKLSCCDCLSICKLKSSEQTYRAFLALFNVCSCIHLRLASSLFTLPSGWKGLHRRHEVNSFNENQVFMKSMM